MSGEVLHAPGDGGGRMPPLVPNPGAIAPNSYPRAAANPAWVGAENGRCLDPEESSCP